MQTASDKAHSVSQQRMTRKAKEDFTAAKAAFIAAVEADSPGLTVHYTNRNNVTIVCSKHGWSRSSTNHSIRRSMVSHKHLCPECAKEF